jgi:DNA-binding response OmpR family regulator
MPPGDALRLAAAHPPAAVLLDIVLPGGIDGCELAVRLRQLPGMAGVPFAAVTARYRDDDRVRCREAGIEHYIVKPASGEELRGVLPPPS